MPKKKKKTTTRATKRKSPPKRKSSPKGRTKALPMRAPKNVLIIECDPDRLAQQTFTIAGELLELVGAFAIGGTHRVVQGRTAAQLEADLKSYAQLGVRPEIVILVSHSSRDGGAVLDSTQAFPGGRLPWESLGVMLAPLQASKLVQVACDGGRWLPCRALFGATSSSLSTIYGSMGRLNRDQLPLAKALVLYLLLEHHIRADWKPDLGLIGFLVGLVTTGGVFVRHTRETFEQTGTEIGGLASVVEDWIQGVVTQLFRLTRPQ